MFADVSAVTAASTLAGALLALLVLRSLTKAPRFAYARPKSTLPIVGNTFDMIGAKSNRLLEWIAEQCEELKGPWELSLGYGSTQVVVISSPEHFEDVLKTQFSTFVRGSEAEIIHDLFGKGILASDGDAWYFHRKTASNLFTHQMIRDVMYEAVRDKSERLMATLKQYEARHEPTSFKRVITHFTTDVFGKIGFGVDLNCLEHGVNGASGNEFVDAFAAATGFLWMRYNLPHWLWGLLRALNVGYERQLGRNLRVINNFIFRIINESIERKQQQKHETTDAKPAKDLISLFLNSKVADSEASTAQFFDSESHLIRDTVVNFIFAGKDTTSHAMSFFVVMMNRYPEVLEKIREELRSKVPAFASGLVSVPSMDELSQLTYLEAAIRENLRLNPVLPFGAREANADTVLSDGTPIAKGTRIVIGIYAGNRSKAVWGEDADAFKPERWIDAETGKLIVVSPFKFSSFFSGPRQCIGMKFALLEMKCALAVLLSRFDLKTVEDPWSITYDIAITMAVKGPLLVDVSARRSVGSNSASV